MSFEYEEAEFLKRINWFEKEFEIIFGNKIHHYTGEDKRIANRFLDRLSETINKYSDEKLLCPLVSVLNRIEKEHPELFK